MRSSNARKREKWVSHNRVLVGNSRKDLGRNPNFDTEETKLLISLWGDPVTQKTLITTHRKNTVIQKLAEKLGEYGYKRSAAEINTRIKNLKCFYNRLKKDINDGAITDPSWKHFAAMDEIMNRAIFSVRPNEIPKPSYRYQLELAKAEREERNKIKSNMEEEEEDKSSNSDENSLSSFDSTDAIDDEGMVSEESANRDSMEILENNIKIENDNLVNTDDDVELIIPKEEPSDKVVDKIAFSDNTKIQPNAATRVSEYIIPNNSIPSTTTCKIVNGSINTSSQILSTSQIIPTSSSSGNQSMPQSIVFTNQQSPMQGTGKISLVPTNFLLQPNASKPQQIQIRQQPQQRIICQQSNNQPNTGIVTTANGQRMKVLLVNAFQNGKTPNVTNMTTAKDTTFPNQTIINNPNTHILDSGISQNFNEPPKTSKSEDSASNKNPDLESLFKKLIDMQYENNEIQKQHLEIERERLDFEKSFGERLLAAITSFQKVQDPETEQENLAKKRKRSRNAEEQSQPPDSHQEVNGFELLTPKVEKED